MLKAILISGLAAIVVIAIGFSAYNGLASAPAVEQQAPTAQGAGYGAGQGTGGRYSASAQVGAQVEAATPAPSGSTESSSLGTAQRAGGQGGGYRRGQSGSQGGSGAHQTQNGMTELATYSGVVSGYAASEFTLLTSDGQSVQVQLGNQSYVAGLGMSLQDGDEVTVTGFVDSSGALAVTSITVQSSGQTYVLRDSASGRPNWAGGRNR